MDLLELDVRLEKDMMHLEKSLVDYEKLINQASTLKYTFEKQTKELLAAYEQKWKEIQVQNANSQAELADKVNEKINRLEADNKRAWINIVNAQTVKEKETLPSKKEVAVADGISDEFKELLEKNRVIEVSIEAINTDMCQLKSDSERSLINLSAELFKETTRAEDKDRKLTKTFKIFMAISSVLFIVLLIWR